MKTTPCEDCGQGITRNQRKNHSRFYCQKYGAPALKERKCAHGPCKVLFVPKPGNPQQIYCTKACWTRETSRKRAERWQAGKLKPTEDDSEQAREAAHMAPIRKREAEVEQKAAQYVPMMGDALYEITMRLMRAE